MHKERIVFVATEFIIMSIIIGEAKDDSIHMETRRRSPIRNNRFWEISPFERSEIKACYEKFGSTVKYRGFITPVYNCHGMTFASRRTRIWESSEITKILTDDEYEKVHETEVLPGDVVIYYAPKGDAEHSGIVLETKRDSLDEPLILSKWGIFEEVIHKARTCPYSKHLIQYYRVKK